MDRRDFLKTGAIATVGTLVATQVPGAKLMGAEADKDIKKSKVAVVRKGEPVAMFQKGIAALGGMTAFVKPGQTVVVKPNIGWDKTPELAANTNPDLIGEIVRQAIAAGASKVMVFDHTCNNPKKCYENSGIDAAVKAAGGEMIAGNNEADYIEKDAPKAIALKKAKIHKAILEADVFINVPILKNHGGAKMTCALKNYMGIVWDRQIMHKNNLQQSIADSALYRVPDLTVVDAYRIMQTNGPLGKNLNDVKMPKYQILSKDIVAADTLAVKILGFKLSEVPHVELADKLGIGTCDEKKMDIVRLDA